MTADLAVEMKPVAPTEAANLVGTQGFAIVDGVAEPDTVATMKVELQRCVDEDLAENGTLEDGNTDAWMVQNLMFRSPIFTKFLQNQVLLASLSPILGDTCIVYAFTSSSMPPNASNYSHRVHVDCPRVIPGYPTNVGFIVPLDDFTVENGATWFLPGSFERSDQPGLDEFMSNAVQVLPKAGQGVVFNARMWHVGGMNTTGRARHALTLNACRSYMRQRFDYPRMATPEVLEELDQHGRRFLGMNVRMPLNMDEYRQRIYAPNQG